MSYLHVNVVPFKYLWLSMTDRQLLCHTFLYCRYLNDGLIKMAAANDVVTHISAASNVSEGDAAQTIRESSFLVEVMDTILSLNDSEGQPDNGSVLEFEEESEYPVLSAAVDYMTWYFMPVIIGGGVIGNCFSLVVFLTTHLNRLSLSVYLAALAISDIGFLLSLLFGWVGGTKFALFHLNGWCQTVVFVSYTTSFLSVWFVVAFTVERYIAICHPFHRPEMCTTARAKKVVTALSTFAIAIYSCNFWTTGVRYDVTTNLTTCTAFMEYYSFHIFLTYVDAVVSLFVPFLAIVIFNVIIAHRIAYFYHKRQRLMSQTHFGEQNARQCRAQIKVTKMLMVVSSVFLFTNLPSYVIRFRVFILAFVQGHSGTSRLELLIQKMFQFLYYSNFAINFLLYSAVNRKFRQAFRRVLWQMRYRVVSLTLRTSTSIRSRDTKTEKIEKGDTKPATPN